MNNKVKVDIYYSGRNFSACVPLLPGCVATGGSPKEINQRIEEAIDLHIKGSIEGDDDIPAIFHDPYELVYHPNFPTN